MTLDPVNNPLAQFRAAGRAAADKKEPTIEELKPEDLSDAQDGRQILADIDQVEAEVLAKEAAKNKATDAGKDDTQASTPGSTSGLEAPLKHCPRCDFQLGQIFDTAPTDKDIDNFALSLIPTSIYRFAKQYVLPGGVVIEFRAMSAREMRLLTKLIQHQHVDQFEMGRKLSEMLFFRLYLLTYRIFKSQHDQTPVYTRPENPLSRDAIDAASTLPDESTKLQLLLTQLTDDFRDDILKSETTERIFIDRMLNFQRTCSTLEALARDPSFFGRVAPQA